jgi:hypothetical protein
MQKTQNHAWEAVTLLASAEHTQETNAAGAAVQVGDINKAIIVLDITASATDAGDTLDVYIDVSWDGGTTWYNAVHFTQQAGDGSAVKEMAMLDAAQYATDPDAVLAITADAAAGVVRQGLVGPLMRVRSTVARVTGTDEAHTFSVEAYIQ